MKAAVDAVASAKVQFVLGDLLPGDLVDEYRVQLQKFLQDPSDANIDAVTAAIEAKAKTFVLMTAGRARIARLGNDNDSSRAEGGERKLTSLRRWIADAPAAYLLLLPVLVLFAFAVVYPLIQTIWLSFWDIKGLAKPKFYGFGNFITLFNDADVPPASSRPCSGPSAPPCFRSAPAGASRCSARWRRAQTLIPRVMIFAAFGVSEAVTGYIWLGIFRARCRRPAQCAARRRSASAVSPIPGSATPTPRSGA